MTTNLNVYLMREIRRAAQHDGWLPDDTGIPELDALRDKHLKALGTLQATVAKRHQLFERQDREAQEHQAAMVQQARDGVVPDVAPLDDDARKRELKAADQAVKAADLAFEQTVREVWAELQKVAPVVDSLVATRRQEAEQARADAERILAEAMARTRAVKKLDLWFDRHVPGRDHFPMTVHTPTPWASMATPPADYEPDATTLRLAGLGHMVEEAS